MHFYLFLFTLFSNLTLLFLKTAHGCENSHFFPCTKWCQASKIFMVHKVIDYKWNKCRCKFNKGIYSHSLVSDKTFLLLLLTAIACLHSMDLSFNAITMNCSQNEENTIDGDLDSDWKQKENQMSWRWLLCNRLRTKGRMNIILC